MLRNLNGGDLKVGFVGAGQMGGAMLRGLARTNTVSSPNLAASDVVDKRLDELDAEFEGKVRTFQTGSDKESTASVYRLSDVVFLAMEPKDMPAVCMEIKAQKADPNVIFVSLAAGVTLDSLASWLPVGAMAARVMPNTPCTVGEMAAGYCVNEACSARPGAVPLVGAILGALGSALRVEDEGDLDAVTGVSGSGPAYVFQFIEALSDGGVRMGLSRAVATELAAKCVRGAATMVLETGRHPGALKDEVTSPGGTTIAAVHALEQGGMRAAVMNAVVAATEKSRELGRAGSGGASDGDGPSGKKRKSRD